MFSAKYSYKTKQARSGTFKHIRDLGITESSFRWSAAKSFNGLPLEIRNLMTVKSFKKAARAWVKENIPSA
jgi:hypothetical protein